VGKLKTGTILQSLVDLLYPRRCPVCGRIVVPKGRFICPDCVGELSWVSQPVCKRCGKELPVDTAEYCLDCTRHPRSFEGGRALLNYNRTASRSMAQIKYNNRREYLDFYAEAMARRLGPAIRRMNAQALVPVPVHPSRMKVRGFNQAEELARRLSKKLGIPVNTGLLRRNRNTIPQKDLNPAQRLKNLQEAFVAVRPPAGLESVILVDDIYTTGSTVEACARALKGAGIERVYFLSICISGGR